MSSATALEVRIIRVQNAHEAAPYRASFAGAYQDIFSDPPYNERFFPSEAQAMLASYLDVENNIVLLAVRGRTKVVGFGIAVPLMAKPAVTRELRGLIPVAHTFYLAELGVHSSQRSRGLGRTLVRRRVDLIDKRRYTHVALRTSAVRNASYEMYLFMGFDDMGVYMEVPSRRLDGRVTTDRRLFLSKVLTAELGTPGTGEQQAFGTGSEDGT